MDYRVNPVPFRLGNYFQYFVVLSSAKNNKINPIDVERLCSIMTKDILTLKGEEK